MSLLKLFTMNLRTSLKKHTNYINLIQTRNFKDVSIQDIPDVTVSGIRSKLKKCEVKYEEHTTNFVIGCPVCKKGDESLLEKTKIFINKRTGAFTCEKCNHTGSWIDIDSYICAKYEKRKINRDPVIIKELDSLNSYLKKVKKNAIPIENLTEEDYKDLLTKFTLPDFIPQSTMKNIEVLVDITYSKIHFPLVNTAFNLVGYLVLHSKSKGTTIEPKLINTQSTGVLISKSLKHKETALLVTTIADFLVLVNAHVPVTVICLPNGLIGLSQYILPCFDKYSKLILWFGSDVTAWDTAKSYARKLGEKRCLVIRPVDKMLLPSMDPNQNFKSVLSIAQPIYHKSITTFASLREDVLADLQNIDRVQGVKWTRFPSLNRILKGHRRGELTVFTGPTGSGKTTFISEYSLDLSMQGVTTLWGSFEIRNARLARMMLQQMAGLPLDEHLEKYDYWADKFENLPIYYMTFHGQQSIKVVMEAIEHATYVHDISHVIIDNLQFMMGLSEDSKHVDRFWKQDLIIANFRTFATRRNCHVTLVIHPRKEKEAEDLTMSSIFGGAKASQEADNIIIIQDKRLSTVRGKKYIQIAKNRYSGDLGIMPLDFDKSSLSFVPKRKRSEEKAESQKHEAVQQPL